VVERTTGPALWLHKDDAADWPKAKNIYCQVVEALLEARTVSHVLSTVKYDLSIVERYSSLIKLIRVIAFCRRFMHNASKKAMLSSALQADEIDKMESSIIGRFLCKGAQVIFCWFSGDSYNIPKFLFSSESKFLM